MVSGKVKWEGVVVKGEREGERERRETEKESCEPL